jgi:hypothetical protein
MAKYSQHEYADFLAVKEKLTAALAVAFLHKLQEMGGEVKGISWFSSVADEYAGAQVKCAA